MMDLVCYEYTIDYKGFTTARIIGIEYGKNDIVFEFYKDDEFEFYQVIYTTFALAEREMVKNYKKWIDKYNRR